MWKRHAFSLGQQARPCHMDAPTSPADGLVKIARLRTGDGAWVRRTKAKGGDGGGGDGDGYVWTYAILKKMSKDTLVFIVNDQGSFKECSVRHWKKCVRVVAPEYALEEEGNDRRASLDAFLGARGAAAPGRHEDPSDASVVDARDDAAGGCVESPGRRVDSSTGPAEPSVGRAEEEPVPVPDHEVSMYALCSKEDAPLGVVPQDHETSGDGEDDAPSLNDRALDGHDIFVSEHDRGEPSDEAKVDAGDDSSVESMTGHVKSSIEPAEPLSSGVESSTGEKGPVLVPIQKVSMYTLGAEGNAPPLVVLQDHEVSMYTLVGDRDVEDDASSSNDQVQVLDDRNISVLEREHEKQAGDDKTGGRVESSSGHAESSIGPEDPSSGRVESSMGEKDLVLVPDHEVSMYTLGAEGDAPPVVILQDHEMSTYTLVGDGVNESHEDDASSLDDQVLDDHNISVLESENEEPSGKAKVEAGDDETGGLLESSSGHAESSIRPGELSSGRVESSNGEKEPVLVPDHEASMYTLGAEGDAPPVVVPQDHEMSTYTPVGDGGDEDHEDDASLSEDQVLVDHNISVADDDHDISMYTFCAGVKAAARDGTAPAAEIDVPDVDAKADRVPTPPSAETDGAKNCVPARAPREGPKASGDESNHAATPPGQRANGVPVCKPFAPTKATRGPDSDRKAVPRMGGAERNRPSRRSVLEGVNRTVTLQKSDYPMLCVPCEGKKATRVPESNHAAKPRVGNVEKKRNTSRSSKNHPPSPPTSISGSYGVGGGDPPDGKRKRRPTDPPAAYRLVRERNAAYRSNDRDPPGAVSSAGLSSKSLVPAKKPRGEAREAETDRSSSKAKERRNVRRLTPISESPEEETGARAENPEKGRLEELPPPAATDRSAGDGCKVKKNRAVQQSGDVPKHAGGQMDTKKNRKKPSRRTTGVQRLSKSLPPTKQVPISESCKEEIGLGLGSSRKKPMKKTANTTIVQLSKSLPPTRSVGNSTPTNEANFSSGTMTPAADDGGGKIETKHDIQQLTESLRNLIGYSLCSGNGKESRMLRDRKVSGYTLDCKTCDDSKDEQSSAGVFDESAVTIKHSNSASRAEYGKWTEPKDKLPSRPIHRQVSWRGELQQGEMLSFQHPIDTQ